MKCYYLDYAVYRGNVIVPLMMLEPLALGGVMDDERAGICRIINKMMIEGRKHESKMVR